MFKVKTNFGARPNTMAGALYANRKKRKFMSKQALVPNLVGLSQSEAILLIRSSGFSKGVVTGTTGSVVSQNPVSAAEVSPYSFIDIVMTS